ncbi:MAG: response regulator [Chitinivibrionales bacterium]|nr:response regulator [Chitinivibrionales bacterium]
MKSLVVDDEMVSRKKMETILSNFGECVAVTSGKTAILTFSKAWHSKSPFELMTLDVSMPDMDGLEVLTRIRDIENESKISADRRMKIIMVTSRSDNQTVLTSLQSGCNDYIVKPFDLDTMKKKLTKFGFAL